ncbi:MAG TPA: DUF177 domain-containing protein [Candidatus Limnocylindrales bacterium]|nr:DUF177 domain-containing protein [Candidatus Limnocylindrales bacterium]
MTGRAQPGRADPEPLVWNVAGLLGEGIGAQRDYAFENVDVDPGEGLQLASPVSGKLRLARTNRGLLLDGEIHTSLATECARCLRALTIPLDLEIHDEALPSIDLHTGAPVALSPEDEELGVLRLTDHHELDLEPAIREAIQLNEPIAPLDREDCPGLCVVCGLPLDEGTHDHPDEEIDPRLEALKAFRPTE